MALEIVRESQLGTGNADAVTGLQPMVTQNSAAIDVRSVLAPAVPDKPVTSQPHNFGMVSTATRVRNHDAVPAGPAD